MTTLDKKAARAAWKERKVVAGIYSVRCLTTGQVWLGATPDLATVEGRLWFDLKQGRHRSPRETAGAARSPAHRNALCHSTCPTKKGPRRSRYCEVCAVRRIACTRCESG